jgi:UDP-glucose 4-epimerase
MRVVVLGGGGFIGSRVADALADAAFDVVAVSRRAAPANLHRHLNYIQGTVDDTSLMRQLLTGAAFLIHMACDTTPGTSQQQPTLECANNLAPTLKLIELAQDFPACKLVFLSSGGAVYKDTSAPVNEESILSPRSYYGAAKIGVEMMLRAYHAQTGNGVFILRPPNVFGPGQNPKRNFGIVPTVLRCLRQDLPFQIWGDGGAVRDYLFIQDFVRFIRTLIDYNWQPNCFEVFNVGSGRGISINALCTAAETLSGRVLQRKYVSKRAVDPAIAILDNTKARNLLGWHPIYTFEDGLAETWTWLTDDSRGDR